MSDSMMARHKAIHFGWLVPELLVCCLAHRGSTGVFLLLRDSVSYWAPRDLHRRVVIMIYLFVLDDSLIS